MVGGVGPQDAVDESNIVAGVPDEVVDAGLDLDTQVEDTAPADSPDTVAEPKIAPGTPTDAQRNPDADAEPDTDVDAELDTPNDVVPDVAVDPTPDFDSAPEPDTTQDATSGVELDLSPSDVRTTSTAPRART